jgi:DNA-binding SARP family transcriptional activator
MHAASDTIRSADSSVARPGKESRAAPPVQVCLFGGLSLLKCGVPLKCRGGVKTEALLVCLAVNQTRGISRERLLAQVWPDADAALAAQSLRSLVHQLHGMLGEAIGGAMPFVHAGEIYRLNTKAGITTDIDTFERLARQGAQAWESGECTAATGWYLEAVDLYRGDLCACRDDSAVVERERLRAIYLVMLGRLADMAFQSADYSSALDYAATVLKDDPGREDAHRTMMLCYAALGQRVQAMRQFLLCERLLRETFDAVPEPSTRALYDRLRLEPG